MIKSNFSIATTLADHLNDLGGIPENRVRFEPPLGTATTQDLFDINERSQDGLFELVDGCLVEKAIGFEASIVAAAIIHVLRTYVRSRKLGLVSGPDGFFRLRSSVRGPDVAFVSQDRLPLGKFPNEPYPAISPNLVVEVWSPGNTRAEMARKRLEYFSHGVQVIWMVDCSARTIAVYSADNELRVFGDSDVIDGGIAVPGFSAKVSDFFADLDIGGPEH